MAEISREYLNLLEEISLLCEAMKDSEKDKRDALLKSDEAALGVVMRDQQAGVMRLESLEKQRAAMQLALGFGTMSAAEMQAQMPEDEKKQQFAALRVRLQNAAEQLKELNRLSIDIAREQLSIIYQVTENTAQAPSSSTYGPGSKPRPAGARPLFEEKV